jgi:membrane associated rhomboid family serine protease
MVWAVLIAIGGAWLVQQFDFRIGFSLMLRLDDGGLRQPWRWATFPLVHFAPIHAFLGGLAVYLFLPQLEREWGWVRALACFVLGNLVGAGVYALFAMGAARMPVFYGAGAGALAVLTAAAYRLPRENIFDAVPNRLMAALVGVIWVLFIVGGRQASDLAHLAGIPFGLAMGAWSARRRRPRMRIAPAESTAGRVRPARPQDELPAIDLRMSLDDVLAKVSREGLQSLSKEERETLEIATRRRRSR